MDDLQKVIVALDKTIEYDNFMHNLTGGRSINLPQEVTENLAIHIIRRVEKVNVKWCKTAQPPIPGDAYRDNYCRVKLNYIDDDVHTVISVMRQINEIKFFSSSGPCSFGPTEKWDIIYFLDGLDYKQFNFKLYKFRLANVSEEWKNLKVNRTETFRDQASVGRRPRMSFDKIKDQLIEHCELIWQGNVKDLPVKD
jgi:hypothetical protein